jgi:hypothetical protein
VQKGLTFEGAGQWTVVGPGKIGHDHRIKGCDDYKKNPYFGIGAVNVYNKDLPSEA